MVMAFCINIFLGKGAFLGPNNGKMGNISGLFILKDFTGKLQRVDHSRLSEPPFLGFSIKDNALVTYARIRPYKVRGIMALLNANKGLNNKSSISVLIRKGKGNIIGLRAFD